MGLRLLLVVSVLVAAALPAIATRLGPASGQCSALFSSSMQFHGEQLASATVASQDECCQACIKKAGCQMWFMESGKSNKCNMYSLDKGPVSMNILYNARAGLMTGTPSALAQQSSDCDGNVWLFKDIEFVGGDKASKNDPYLGGKVAFSNGFPAKTWQDCCNKAREAPGTLIMERSYQYRARQFFTWSAAEGKCWVKVRPYLPGSSVITLKKASGMTSGMFGNEL